MKYCTNNGDLVFLLAVLSLMGLCAFSFVVVNFFFNFKQKRCTHDLLIKSAEVEAYSHAELEKVSLVYYRCEHCEKEIKKTTSDVVKEEAKSLGEVS